MEKSTERMKATFRYSITLRITDFTCSAPGEGDRFATRQGIESGQKRDTNLKVAVF